MPSLLDPDGLERAYLHNLAALSGAYVLEIGSGDGRLTWDYAGAARYVMAIDPDPGRVATARYQCPPVLRGSLSFSRAKVEALPFRNECFDIVLMAWSF